MTSTTIINSSKFQIVIPKAIRELLGLEPGQKLPRAERRRPERKPGAAGPSRPDWWGSAGANDDGRVDATPAGQRPCAAAPVAQPPP
jgi:hypothetical protein